MTSSALKKLEEMEVEEKIKFLRKLREKSLKKNIENSKKVLFTNVDEEVWQTRLIKVKWMWG